uniref:Uncharacterized protein n=1 Tax=Setaria italica TaxID=4555 RepID=K4APC4_SETIT
MEYLITSLIIFRERVMLHGTYVWNLKKKINSQNILQ